MKPYHGNDKYLNIVDISASLYFDIENYLLIAIIIPKLFLFV